MLLFFIVWSLGIELRLSELAVMAGSFIMRDRRIVRLVRRPLYLLSHLHGVQLF